MFLSISYKIQLTLKTTPIHYDKPFIDKTAQTSEYRMTVGKSSIDDGYTAE